VLRSIGSNPDEIKLSEPKEGSFTENFTFHGKRARGRHLLSSGTVAALRHVRLQLLVQRGVIDGLASFAFPALFTFLPTSLASFSLRVATVGLSITLLAFTLALLVGSGLLLHPLLPGFVGGRGGRLLQQSKAFAESHCFAASFLSTGFTPPATTSNLNNTRALHYATNEEY
jgi:hypothetical protein